MINGITADDIAHAMAEIEMMLPSLPIDTQNQVDIRDKARAKLDIWHRALGGNGIV